MKTLKGKTTIELTIDAVNELNEMIERNEKKPIVHNDEYNLGYCPNCGSMVFDHYDFCSKCGQRLDKENYAL